VLHAVLGVLLVPRLGLAGALVAITIANVAAALWFAFRLSRSQAWPIGKSLWEPFLFPGMAIAAGFAAGAAAERGIPAPWVALGAAGAAAGATALLVLLASRHLEWGELVRLGRRGVTS
jgi:peptidoglycan biosynthesis protein MviN/MurJ (putative lipid II flippase)